MKVGPKDDRLLRVLGVMYFCIFYYLYVNVKCISLNYVETNSL